MTFSEWRASNSGHVVDWGVSGIFTIYQSGYYTVRIHKESENKPSTPEIGSNWIETFRGSRHWVQDIS